MGSPVEPGEDRPSITFRCFQTEIDIILTSVSKAKVAVSAGFGRHSMPLPASSDTGTALGQDGDLATSTLKVMAPVADAGRRPPSVYTKIEICKPWRSEDTAHDVCQH